MSEYCLRWNNHQPNFVKVFSDLLHTEALVDVTLAADGHFVQAHQLVLSACSVYFKELFMTNSCKHPIVILKDIRIEDLKTIIDFIYRGEVNVCQERLPDVLKVAGSLRIKGLAENQQNVVEEIPSHGGLRPRQQASSSLRNDLQSTSQRSSLTDSREQSLSVEGDDLADGAASSPPAKKKRKISSQESSESVTDYSEDKLSRLSEVKEEPRDERENERSQSRETESEYNVTGVADAMLMLQSGNGDGGDDSSSTVLGGSGSGPAGGGNSSSGEGASLVSHSQGRNKRGVLQRQPGIIRDSGNEEKQETPEPEYIIPDSITVTPTSTIVSTAGVHGRSVLSTPSMPVTLLQVPAVVMGPRDNLSTSSSTPPPLHKQVTQTPLLVPNSGPAIISKQISHPETSIPRLGLAQNQHGPPSMSKQRSHPGVLTHTTTMVSEHGSPSSKMSDIQYQVVYAKQKPPTPGNSSSSQQLRPIQPKPPESDVSCIKKEVPLIHLTPTDDSGFNMSHRLPRAVSEEPRHFNLESSGDLLSAAGPSPLIQSVSQDSALDQSGVGMNRLLGQHSLVSGVSISTPGLTQSSPGHCPVLREGPALGCNYCWNSADSHGRVLRRKTKYHCPECRTNLCIVPCFHEYHKQIERHLDTQKQINKFLTKQSSSSM